MLTCSFHYIETPGTKCNTVHLLAKAKEDGGAIAQGGQSSAWKEVT